MLKRKLEKKLAHKIGIFGDRQAREDKGGNLPIGSERERTRKEKSNLSLSRLCWKSNAHEPKAS